MKNGYKVADMDTHVGPSMETLEKYVDPSFRPRMPEFEPYRRHRFGQEAASTVFVQVMSYERKIGEVPTGKEGEVPRAPREGPILRRGAQQAITESRLVLVHRMRIRKTGSWIWTTRVGTWICCTQVTGPNPSVGWKISPYQRASGTATIAT